MGSASDVLPVEEEVCGLGLQELRQLRDENAKLKRLVADLTLDRHILEEIVAKNCKPSCATRAGGVDASCPPIEPAAGGKADSDRADDLTLHASSRSAGGLASSSARVCPEPCALRLPAADGATQARALGVLGVLR
jgi:hypothetical protein